MSILLFSGLSPPHDSRGLAAPWPPWPVVDLISDPATAFGVGAAHHQPTYLLF